MTAQVVRAGPDWLALREPADAVARSRDLVRILRPHLPSRDIAEIHDLGCGTGAMGRWLAPQLPGPQRWTLYDRDEGLLARATADAAVTSADGFAVGIETRATDITQLASDTLFGASLITASALLDMFTFEDLDRFVASCTGPGCAVHVTLSVVGRVRLTPADPLDAVIADAFNAHQRRPLEGATLLGPHAFATAVAAFTDAGRTVIVRPSPWRLGPTDANLMSEWLTGWVAAACDQHPDLQEAAAGYLERRAIEMQNGHLWATVHHNDLLVLPR